MKNETMNIKIGCFTLSVEPTVENKMALTELNCLLIFIRDELEGDTRWHDYTLNSTVDFKKALREQLLKVGYLKD